MPAQTFTPNAVAREASTKSRTTVTDKMVRGYARATMRRFNKALHPARQSHEYSAAERTVIVAHFVKRAAANRPTPAPRKRASAPKRTPTAPNADA